MHSNKTYQYKFDEKLKEWFFNRHKFSNHSNHKFVLLFRKGVYPYEYIDDKEKFNGTSLLEKDDFVKILKKKVSRISRFAVQSDFLLLADVFENFRNMCI